MAQNALFGQFTGTLVAESCSLCGIPFGLTNEFYWERKRDHKTFYCPNGHSQHYAAKTDAEQAREEAEQARRIAASEKARAESWKAEAQIAQRSAAASRGVVTKIKRRVSKGICPCCRRTFADLAAHMHGQHPDWSKADG